MRQRRAAGLDGPAHERVDLRVEVLCRLAAAQRHLGDPAGSLAILEEAQQIVQSPEGRVAVPDEPTPEDEADAASAEDSGAAAAPDEDDAGGPEQD